MAATTQQQLDYLISQNLAEYKDIIWGSKGSIRKCVIIDGKTYQYKGGSNINITLKNKISSLYIDSMPKSSKEKTKKTDIITATADLKFDTIEGDERTWINKDKFYEFKQQYDETQDNSSLDDANNIQYNIEVLIRNITTKKEDIKKAFPPMQVVYGGLNAIKLFLKNVIIETVYAYEDSGYEILEINLVRLYINSKRQYKNTNFSNIKMYNLVFNYRGYMLDMIKTKTPNSCVPEYILNTLNNPNEKTAEKRYQN